MLLDVCNVSIRFGGLMALNRVNLQVEKGSITALIGPNGAGKTTLFNCITGFYRPTLGHIALHHQGQQIHLSHVLGEKIVFADLVAPQQLLRKIYYKWFGGSHCITRLGIARTFQNIRLFREMTTLENLLVAQHQNLNRNLIKGIFATSSFRQAEKKAVEQAVHWLQFFDLLNDANRLAGELPYGNQRRLEIARALCTHPILLCLDEPAAGLNPKETQALSHLIMELNQKYGLSILMIEHDMTLVMGISHKIVVLDHGEVIAEGSPHHIQNHPDVIAAYLGEEHHE